MERREFLKASLLGGTAALIGRNGPGEIRQDARIPTRGIPDNLPRQRNILLLISDDHGIDQLGCYGNPVIRTPNLDGLAKRGVRFTNAFAVAPSCSASRGTILTGLYPHQNGQFGHEHAWHHFSLLDWVETMPGLLSKAGYRTGLIGKLHVASKSGLRFDFRPEPKELMGNRDVRRMAEYASEFFAAEPEKPFLLLVGYSDPHREDQGMTSMKNVENFSGFANSKQYRGVTPVRYRPEDVRLPGYLPDIPEVREELADQYEAVSRLDTGVGWILESLRLSGREQDTLVIYLSDNGIPFPGAKTNVYDSGTHVPLIVSSPELAAGGSVNASMVSTIDLLPSILEWAGAKPPGYSLPGLSFLGILGNADDLSRTEVFASHTFHELTMFYPMRSVRTRRFRYILNLHPELEFPFATDLFVSRTWQGILQRKLEKLGKRNTRAYLFRPREELYEVSVDPSEARNLALEPGYAGVLQELRASVQRMRSATEDYWLINDHYIINRSTFGGKEAE